MYISTRHSTEGLEDCMVQHRRSDGPGNSRDPDCALPLAILPSLLDMPRSQLMYVRDRYRHGDHGRTDD